MLPNKFRPMRASEAELDKIRFPVMASPKMDGIRCITTSRGALSRTLKEIPNHFVQKCLADAPLSLDGELLTFTDGVRDDYNTVQSKLMSRDGEPDFKLMTFDTFSYPDTKFHIRESWSWASSQAHPWTEGVVQPLIPSMAALISYEEQMVDELKWEGVMIRDPNGRYKFGKSTVREGILLKFKRFEDAEAEIIGFIEKETNTNEAVQSALGTMKRSSHKDGKVKAGTMGALSMRWFDEHKGMPDFEVGTGFTDEQRQEIWDNREKYLGTKRKISFQGFGSKGRPRFPSDLGPRPDIDILPSEK